MIAFTGVLSTIYFVDVLFNLFLVGKSIHTPPELSFTEDQIKALKDKDLPVYTILVPLYKEANVLEGFVESMSKMDYPKSKLDVILLLEADDTETQQKAKSLKLPKYIRSLVVPLSSPKTKPKACNYGLSFAKGEYAVIYDAEDQPDPAQLKKAILGFRASPPEVGCLQAKLNYHNKDQNLLTRFFTAEYSLWFDVVLPGLQSINTAIPLGGTSNHFRVQDLITFQGWDAFNVTEDADLGSRLFKAGFRTAIIDSVTLEEANSRVGNWVRQRSRWIKGYMQTFLVHNRDFKEFFKTQGIHAIIFQLTVGGKIAFMLINPLLWIATISYFVFYSIVGPTIESFYPPIVFYMAAFSLVFGNFLFIYYYMIGVAKHGHWSLVKFIFLVPLYWLMISRAALKALYQLFFNPHYWEKTVHGLHLNIKKPKFVAPEIFSKAINHKHSGTVILVFASLFGNVMNFLYSVYLGNTISLEQFGLISLFGSFSYLTQIPFSVFSNIVTQTSAYHFGKEKVEPKYLWRKYRKWSLVAAIFFSFAWIISIPLLRNVFKSDSLVPFIIFTPVWIIGLLAAVDGGFLTGSHRFKIASVLGLTEAVSKFVLTVLFVTLNQRESVYFALPLSMLISFIFGWYFSQKITESETHEAESKVKFPFKFAGTIILNKLSFVAFLGLDILIAKIILSPDDAGRFALVSLIGKMLYFFSSLSGQFILPMVSKAEGAQENSKSIFNKIFVITLFFTISTYLGLGIFGWFFAPLLFGAKMLEVTYLLPFYLLGIACYTLANSIIAYHQSRKNYLVSVISFVITIAQVFFLIDSGRSLSNYSYILGIFGIIQLLVVASIHRLTRYSTAINQNTFAFFDLFKKSYYEPKKFDGQIRFLILNWRDIKHKWAGGAEIYVHELAKNLVEKGHQVTIFSGNDGKSKNKEILDGVEVIRRGGFFMVYIWAAIYYVTKFQDRFDIIIDSENGIPFFTPIYSRRPKFLLIHHVHQEFFNDSLKFPMREIAKFLEGKVMPYFYRYEKVMTVSESTKKDVLKLGIFNEENICIVNPGIDIKSVDKSIKKTDYPSILYLGRLKPYKNVDIAIKSFKKVLEKFPNAILNIAGEGDCEQSLKDLVKNLDIEKSVVFHGRVDEETTKPILFKQSWVMVQPSSFEGWGITVIEANQMGTPVVASDIPGLRDSVLNGETGILVKPKSIKEFSKALIKVIKNSKLRQKMSDAGIERAKKFNWSENTNIFLSAIQRYYLNYNTNEKI
jgi:glycosyltransferase involved in cell wall biosynthesis/cellulose synthase/poly-beta-1,6-N-acetylglucosamine synthase-like glycosyltransferase/O-antigen/teichoic acid export membrane protein